MSGARALVLLCSALLVLGVQFELNNVRSLVFFVCRASQVVQYNPVADPKAVVVSGRARFTVLTDRIIRFEYSNTGAFEDRASLAFLNRRLQPPSYTTNVAGDILQITTKALSLSYQTGTQFLSSTLNITVRLSGTHLWCLREGL
jgi:hypothetical protein